MKKYFYTLFIFIIFINIQGCGKVQFSEKEVRIELGDFASENISDYICVNSRYEKKLEKEALLDLSDIETSTVGTYQAVITYKEQRIVVPVIVEDTTPPDINCANITFNEGDQVRDCELVEITDQSRVTLHMEVNGKIQDSVILYPGITLMMTAIDDYGNENTTEIIPNVTEMKEKNIANGRRVIDWKKYSPEEIYFVNENIYSKIKDAYSNVEWGSKFEIGDLAVYELYKKKFRELLTNEKPYYNEEGKEMFLKDYYYMQSIYENQDTQGVDFYFFDMDEDDKPELGITTVHFILIIKYDEKNDRFLLWKKYESTYYEILGSRTMRYDGGGLASCMTYAFYKLGKNGNEECTVSFVTQVYFDEKIDDFKEIYLMMLPKYNDKDKQVEISEEIKKQGYCYEDNYYFRVTKEQYEELTNEFFEASYIANKEIRKVTYSYEEMVN